MTWKFDNNLPIYVQICNAIKLQIVTGQLAIGDRLPSVRDLAETAGVNPNTIQRALSDLESQGFVYSMRTTGRFVSDNPSLLIETRRSLATKELDNFVNSMKNLGFKQEEIIPTLLKHIEGAQHDTTVG